MKKLLSLIFIIMIITATNMTASAQNYVYASSVDGELSLHILPNEESYKITDVPACSALEVIKRERTWGLVVFDNKCGWINMSFTRNTYNEAAQATGNSLSQNTEMITNKEQVNLYNVPSESEKLGSEIKYTVPKGLVLTITRETPSGWGLVFMNGSYAWVQLEDTEYYSENSIDPEQFSIYYVYVLSEDGKGLSLWGNENGGNLCAVIPDCTKLTVREEKNNFGHVSYDGINGWIDLTYTAMSLETAQMNAGTSVNVEYEIKPKDGEKSVDMLSVPSDNPADGATVVGSVKEGTIVYVLRTTFSGWSLINHNGKLGWIPPENAVPSEIVAESTVAVLENQREGYVATSDKKGVKVYTDGDEKNIVATLAECMKVKVVAHQNGYEYVSCDYASGWVESYDIKDTYEEAVEISKTDKKTKYITTKKTALMNIPSYLEICAPEKIADIDENKYIEIVKQTVFEGKTWGLARFDDKWGWIDLQHVAKLNVKEILLIGSLAVIAILMVITVVVLHILKRKQKKRKNIKKKEFNENGILNDSSGTEQESADVSGK